jgi:hypothetical protein
MNLTEHRFDELSRLLYRVFTCELGGKHNPTALVLQFSGVYGVGSAGNSDATFMRVITLAALSAWRSDAVVFDFRELTYEWGNSIWSLFGHGIERSGVEGLPCPGRFRPVPGRLFDVPVAASTDVRRSGSSHRVRPRAGTEKSGPLVRGTGCRAMK